MKSILNILATVFVCLMIPILSFGTVICPFENPAAMAQAAPAGVVMARVDAIREAKRNSWAFTETDLTIVETLKGNVPVHFTIRSMSSKSERLVSHIMGDCSFNQGDIYFLCLDYGADNTYKPTMLMYGVLKSISIKSVACLVPAWEENDFALMPNPNGTTQEPYTVYDRNAFLEHLSDCIHLGTTWQQSKTLPAFGAMNLPLGTELRTPPSHCTFFTGANGYNARWTGFPSSALPLKYKSTGDSGCGDAVTKITAARNNMTTQYPGIKIPSPTTHSFSPGCADGSAIGNDFIDFCNNNGGDRQLLIQFNDPCSEIADLDTNCIGILAIGGTYWYEGTPHMHDGLNWWDAAYGFVVTNNKTGMCYCNSGNIYRLTMTHEMTHALDVGHIASGAGTANMNPVCCNEITSLDQQCLNYMYPASMPLELVAFTAQKNDGNIAIEWITQSEIGIENFVLQHSRDGIVYQNLSELKPLTNKASIQKLYQYHHLNPGLGDHYYRIGWKDLGGQTFSYSPVRKVSIVTGTVQVFPNPVTSTCTVSLPQGVWNIHILNAQGMVVDAFTAEGNILTLDHDLIPGLYTLQLTDPEQHLEFSQRILVQK
jgi:hypothetical protein